MDRELAEWLGLCWHEWEILSRSREWEPEGAYISVMGCKKCSSMTSLYDGEIEMPDFTSQIVVDGEPQSLLVHHLKLKGELEGFLEWHAEQSVCNYPTPRYIEDAVVVALEIGRDRQVYTDILLTPVLLRQAVHSYMKWRLANGS